MDGISEKYIIDLIKNIKDEKSILFISHRASSINNFKKVIFLEDGEINAVGSHENLITNNIHYQRNFNTIIKN